MQKAAITILLVAAIGLGGYVYLYGANDLLVEVGYRQTAETKCITKDGRVIYGELPEGTVCEKVEAVDGAVTVIEGGLSPNAEETELTDYVCDGRRYCSQMTSCEEANYFLLNCPGVEMETDSTGTPCIEQLCGY